MKATRTQTLTTKNVSNDVNDKVDEPLGSVESVKPEQNVLQQVPQKTLYNVDLKNITCFKKLRQNAKVANMRKQFENDIWAILDLIPPNEENELDENILLQICQLAENYYFLGDAQTRNEQKQISINNLMLPYFRYDKKLLNTMVLNLSHKIKKLSYHKRMYKRLKLFFWQSLKVLIL